ncbi:MAG: efflux RND transporter periplasmic adaptor subunit [Verrucomicrobiota bacterium]
MNAPATPPPSPLTPPKRASQSSGQTILWIIVALVGCFVIWQFGLRPRMKAKEALREDQNETKKKSVAINLPHPPPTKTALLLPGQIQANRQTTLYARANGYVKRWLVDMGDQVKEGDLLAELETPELDQQLHQANANLDQAKASLALAQSTADRWKNLLKEHAVSQQETDEKVNAATVREADMNAAKADVDRLTALQGYKQILAPFDGVITARNLEVGSLVNADAGGKELYRLQQIDKLRVFVDVPQTYMRSITQGLPAIIQAREFGTKKFTGTVTRTSNSINEQTKTLRTEIELPNPEKTLLPGMYAQVSFQLTSENSSILLIAPTSLMVRADGNKVFVVDENGKISPKSVEIGRDLGVELEIISGLSLKDRVISNPNDDFKEGMTVDVIPSDAEKK